MNAIELQAQKDLDHEILFYVREMQRTAPVTAESVHGFITGSRRRKVTFAAIQDRLSYLTDAKYLARDTEWQGGELVTYRCTAEGMDLLDGRIPPRDWTP